MLREKPKCIELFFRFKNGRKSIDAKPSMVRTNENLEKIREIIEENWRWTNDEIV